MSLTESRSTGRIGHGHGDGHGLFRTVAVAVADSHRVPISGFAESS
jgi:hypothetical protein